MQRGQIYKHNGSWLLRFWDVTLVEGKRKKVRRAQKLAQVGSDYPNLGIPMKVIGVPG